MTDIVRVVVVDDSAYVRKVVKQMLSRSPFIEVVGTARDGAEALEMVAELKPDVVTCDLNMPAMDGVAFVRAADGAAGRCRSSSSASPAQSGEQVLAALDAGAIDFVQKPTALATDKLLEIADELIEKVKAAAAVAAASSGAPPRHRHVQPPRPRPARSRCQRRHRRHRHLDRRPQALKRWSCPAAADFPVPVAHGAAHAGRLHGDVRRAS